MAAASQGAVTGDQSGILVLAFSEPVAGLAPSSFTITGPPAATVKAVKLLPGTRTFYHVYLLLPADHYGPVTITFTVSVQRPLSPSVAVVLNNINTSPKEIPCMTAAQYLHSHALEKNAM